MTVEQAKRLLKQHKYTPGVSSTSRDMDPEIRAEIKRACRVLFDAERNADQGDEPATEES